MSLLVFCLLPILTEFWMTLGSPSPPPISKPPSNIAVPLYNESLSEGVDMPPSSTAISTTTNVETSSYLTRLDFISVIVICAIVAICFGICVVIGCHKKKHRPSNIEITDSPTQSFNDSRSEARVNNLAYSSRVSRVPESPPPTYSIIERQMSFTSYISQTSSQYDVPPDYDEALSIGGAADGEPSANRSGRPGSTNGAERPSGRSYPTKGSAVAARSKRSESARNRGPPRARSHRSNSDITRPRRGRLSSRPATVSEDDSSRCGTSVSAVTDASSDHEVAQDDASHAIVVRSEVIPDSRAFNSGSERNSDAEFAQPLLPRIDPSSSEFDEDDAESGSCNQKKGNSVTRKLTQV